MAAKVNSVSLTFLDAEGNSAGRLKLFAPEGSAAIALLSEDDVAASSEERVQIYEATRYEYEVDPPQLRPKLATGVGALKESANPSQQHCGYLELGSYVGRLRLLLIDAAGDVAGVAAVEVCTKKLDYRDDLRSMIEEITEQAVELAFELRSPTTLRGVPDPSADTRTLYQQFAFLSGLLDAKPFRDALYHIISRPHERLDANLVPRDLRQGFKPTGRGSRELARGGSRFPVPNAHCLNKTTPTLPTTTLVRSSRRSEDNAENRFVRFALEEFSQFLSKLVSHVEGSSAAEHVRLIKDANRLLSLLDGFLTSSVLSGLSPIRRVPLDSTVLQRKEGYREILQAWLRFDLAARLVWEGAGDVYDLGQRDVATLYEYWVFFRLLRIVSDYFSLDPEASKILIEETGDRLGLKLKSGANVAFRGHTIVGATRLNVRFDYNRTFVRRFAIGEPGSWTERMRPDYTLTLWTGAENEQAANESGRAVHVHFDAKYRIETLDQLFGKDDADSTGSEGEVEQAVGTYKRVDLLKMHAYRDAIRRSYGAYVLYPGQIERRWTGYHELLPGLGAFVLRPGSDDASLREFIGDLIKHVASASAQQEVAAFTATTYAGTSGSMT